MAGQVVQGIDTLLSAMKGNIIPDQEYLLQGSLLDSHIEVFKHRLRGLCDNTLGGEEQFCEREMVFSIRGTSQQPLSLRVRKTENLGAPPHIQRYYQTCPIFLYFCSIFLSYFSQEVVHRLISIVCEILSYIIKGVLYI